MQFLNATKFCAVNLIAVLQNTNVIQNSFACPYADDFLNARKLALGYTLKLPIMKRRIQKGHYKYESSYCGLTSQLIRR